MSFFKSFFAALLALVVFSILSTLLFFGWIAALSAEEAVTVKSNSVLHLTFPKPIAERELEDPLADVFPGSESGYTGVIQLRESILTAKNDENIVGILIESSDIFGGTAQLEEIRNALIKFKESGKFVYAFGEDMTEAQLYVNSIADSIFLAPNGFFEFNGMVLEVPYLKKMFDKLDIEAQVFKVGDFKDAVEPFIRTDMSEQSKAQNLAFISDIHNHFLQNIADARGLNYDDLAKASSELQVQNNQDAVELGLIDRLAYEDQMLTSLAQEMDVSDPYDIDFISHESYQKADNGYKSSKNRIAVIVAEGNIVNGEGANESVGSSKFLKEIRKARLNKKVKAIVIRVNSPGGSFTASDLMWRELKLASEVKPVIASMSTYAASGGYYISMMADTIVAYPNTVTGSIGIFSVVPNLGDFMDNKIGITFDGVKTGEYSDIYTVTRPLNEFEKGVWQKQTEEGYDTFITNVAEGRGMTKKDVEAVASGRVWTGNQALERGLVDVLGGFDTAVEIAADKAGVEDYKLYFYPEQKTALEELVAELTGTAQMKFMQMQYGDLYPMVKKLKSIEDITGTQARMPFQGDIDIRY